MISRRTGAKCLAGIGLLVGALHAQTGTPPVITSLQSSLINANAPTNGPAITAQTPITAFTLYINGNFSLSINTISATWTSQATGAHPLQLSLVSSLQIRATIPSPLYTAADVAAITVTQTPQISGGTAQTSNAAIFTVNPALSFPITGNTLPPGTVGQPYSQPFFAGGTPPFSVSMETGLPPGMNTPSTGNPFTGTPTQAGNFAPDFFITDSWNNSTELVESFAVFAVPVLTQISPNTVPVGSPSIQLAVTGTNFDVSSVVQFVIGANGSPLATVFVDANHLTATIPAGLLTSIGVDAVRISFPSGPVSNSLPFSVISNLQVQVPGSSSATVGAFYDLRPAASGGVPPYLWTVGGLPAGLSINRNTGEISGTPSQSGSSQVALTVTDSSSSPQSAIARFTIVVTSPAPPPVQITTGSVLPVGTVGQPYNTVLFATGGNFGPYTFTLTGGALPAGITLTSGGGLIGTPTTAGQYSFTVQAADSQSGTGSATFALTVNPASLAITTPALSPVQVGAVVNTKFAAVGGTAPYTFSLGGTTAPAGTSLAADGTLSGAATTAGTFAFRVTVTDSVKATATQSYTLQVNPATLAITSAATLPAGQVGVAYTFQFAATGGTAPYTWTGLPSTQGLGFFTSGLFSGTPTAAGAGSFSVTVTDAAGAKATGTFSLTIAPAAVTITTSTLPVGTAGSPYAATLTATGGVKPYTWAATGLPGGISVNAAGAIAGTPITAGNSFLNVTVTDSAGASAKAALTLTIAQPAIGITTASLPSGTVGTAYSASVAATGGTTPYTFSATGLPGGLTISAAGVISGTPSAAGTATVVVTAKDAAGITATKTLSLTVALPATPAVSFIGLATSSAAAAQSSGQVGLASAYPVDITVKLTLTFTPDSGADDPSVQFSSGGRSAQLTIPAGATLSAASVAVQTGTVAGNINITAQLLAAAQDITPSPAPVRTIRIGPAPPVITSVTAVRNATGFTVTVVGYATTRSVTQATFQFGVASSPSLVVQIIATVTVTSDALFTAWYQSAAAAPFGGQFMLTQPFTVQGSPQAVGSVTVTLTNATGTSNAVSAVLQ